MKNSKSWYYRPIMLIGLILRTSYLFISCLGIVVLIQQHTTFIASSEEPTLTKHVKYDNVETIVNISNNTLTVSTAAVRPRIVPVVTEVFNASCHTDVLDLPEYVSNVCRTNKNNSKYKDLTCLNLLSKKDGNDKIYKDARQFMLKNKKPTLTDETFISMTSDCDKYREMRGFEKKAVIEEDLDFSIAFNLLVHRDIEMVEKLIYGLYRRQHQFCLYIDTKSSMLFKTALLSLTRCLPNVFVASKLESVIYAGYSRLQADINCMKDHLSRNSNWQYVINTAGEAYPLRSQREMINILRLYNGSNDIEGIYGPRNAYLTSRYKIKYVESVETHKLLRTNKKNPAPPHEINIVKGSAYGAFSRGFVEYLLSNDKSRDLLEWLKTTYSPDEMYWSTLHHRYINPQFHAPGASLNPPTKIHFKTVYANWNEKCWGRWSHSICITGVSDLPNIVKRPELFVNKFHSDFEPLAMDCLRAWIDHKEFCPVSYNYDSYRQHNIR